MTQTLSAAQKKQTKILEVAAELFLAHGYDAVSLDDILERVGGSKTTLYSYYGGKEGLFAAIVHANCMSLLQPLLALDVTDMEPRRGLTAIGESFLSVISNSAGQALYRMMVAEASRFPDLVTEFYTAGPEAVTKKVKQSLEHWQKKGLLRRSHSETMAIQFIGIIIGNFSTKTMLCVPAPLSQQDIQQWVARGVTLFLEGALPSQ